MENMGDGFLIATALGALDGLSAVAEQQISWGWGFQGDLIKLNDKLTTIRAFLRDAENRRIWSVSMKELLTNLRPVIRDASDVLDELEYESARTRIEVHNKVRDFFSLSNPLTFRLKLVQKIKHINLLMEKIRNQANDVGLTPVEDNCLGRAYNIDIKPEDYRRIAQDQPRMFKLNYSARNSKGLGWDIRVSIVRDSLLPVGSREGGDNLSVVALVGLGGVGKTTLAQLVYNDEKVVENFGAKRMFISASDDFNVGRLLNEMMQSLLGGLPGTSNGNVERVKELLGQKLAGGKFLLVLDGIWNANAKTLVDMRSWFQGISDSQGSKILVTTRTVEVVLTMREFPCITHNLDELSGDDSWTIFRKIAFKDGGPRETDTLVEIGRRIVEKCKGLPFLIESVAELLHSKLDEEEWGSMENDETWNSEFLQLLRTSFDRLPSPSLKRCFAYCSAFPKGSVKKKDELIQLWMNLGYLHSPLGTTTVTEDLGDAYFGILLLNSVFQDVEVDEYQNITSCTIHNHMHDLAMHVSEGRCLTLEPS